MVQGVSDVHEATIEVKKNSFRSLLETVNAYKDERTILVPKGAYAVTEPLVVDTNSFDLQGHGWDTILTPESAMNVFELKPPAVNTTLSNVRIRDLQIHQNYRNGYPIDGLTYFTAGSATEAINMLRLERLKILEVQATYAGMAIRNPDNRCLFLHNYFTAMNGKDIYVEANGRAGGQPCIHYNWFSHGNCEGAIHILAHETNIKRVSIAHNTFVSTDTTHARVAVLLETDTTHSALLDYVNIYDNSFEDWLTAIDVGGGTYTGLVRFVKIRDNSFENGSAEANQIAVYLRATSRSCTVVDNTFESAGNIGLTGILDLDVTAANPNIISPNTYKDFAGTDTTYTKSIQSLKLTTAAAD